MGPDVNVAQWLGSTAPTVGQKTKSESIPVVLASDQSPIPVSTSGGERVFLWGPDSGDGSEGDFYIDVLNIIALKFIVFPGNPFNPPTWTVKLYLSITAFNQPQKTFSTLTEAQAFLDLWIQRINDAK